MAEGERGMTEFNGIISVRDFEQAAKALQGFGTECYQLAEALGRLSLTASITNVTFINWLEDQRRIIQATEHCRGVIWEELLSWGVPESWAEFVCERLPEKIIWRFSEMIELNYAGRPAISSE